MRTLDVRRHSLTKKGEGRGRGSHLSQAGVELARKLGAESGPYDRIVASPVPRTLETAIAMGFAVDDIMGALGPEEPHLFEEIGHHERWSWEHPFAQFAQLIQLNGPTARLSQMGAQAWTGILDALPEDGTALAISHGRVIECAAVKLFPDADHASWGTAFQHGEGIRVVRNDHGVLDFTLLRVQHIN